VHSAEETSAHAILLTYQFLSIDNKEIRAYFFLLSVSLQQNV